MSTEDNTPPIEPFTDPATEARIVAMILGEASDFERAELEDMLAEQPALRALHSRLSKLHALLGASESLETNDTPPEEWKLPDERRSALLAKIKSPTPTDQGPATLLVEAKPHWNRWPWISAAAALIMLCFFVPTVFKGTMDKSASAGAMPEARSEDFMFDSANPDEAAANVSTSGSELYSFQAPTAQPTEEDSPESDSRRRFFLTSPPASELATNEKWDIPTEAPLGETRLNRPESPRAAAPVVAVSGLNEAAESSAAVDTNPPSDQLFATVDEIMRADDFSEPSIDEVNGTVVAKNLLDLAQSEPEPDLSLFEQQKQLAKVTGGMPGLEAESASEEEWDFSNYQPGQHEYYRFPGHPAMVSLSSVFYPDQNLDDYADDFRVQFNMGYAFDSKDGTIPLHNGRLPNGTSLDPDLPSFPFESRDFGMDPGVTGDWDKESFPVADPRFGDESGKTSVEGFSVGHSSEHVFRGVAFDDQLAWKGATTGSNVDRYRVDLKNHSDVGIAFGSAVADDDSTTATDAQASNDSLALLDDGAGSISLERGEQSLTLAELDADTDGLDTPTFDQEFIGGATNLKSFGYGENEGRESGQDPTPAKAESVPSGGESITGIGGIAERETIRRLERVKEAEADVAAGQRLLSEKDYKGARVRFQAALEKTPDAPLVEAQRDQAINLYADTSVLLADQKAREGARDEAKDILASVLADGVDPSNEDAKKILVRLDDPAWYSHALIPQHAEDVAKVDRLLKVGRGYYDLGDYDNAEKQYDEVLKTDPYNVAARRGQLELEHQRSKYLDSARDHTRALLLRNVDQAWEAEVPQLTFEDDGKPNDDEHGTHSAGLVGGGSTVTAAVGYHTENLRLSYNFADADPDYLNRKLSETVIPSVRFDEATVEEALGFLQRKTVEHDALETDESRKGINMVIRDEDESVASAPTITLNLSNVTAGDALAQVAEIAGFDIDIEPVAAVLTPKPRKQRQTKAAIDLEVATTAEPFSTFSLNVSDVSFKLAQAALIDNGTWPEAAKIRPEEFVNALDYADPMPAQDEAVSNATEQCVHPFLPGRNLLRVSMQTAATGRSASTPLRLTVLLDKSGSMERDDREASVAKAMEALAAQLKEGDEITVVGFARTPTLIADRLAGADADQLVKLVADAPSEGGTNLEEALRLAAEAAGRQFLDGAENRIVLLTDGAANLGDAQPDSLQQKIIDLRQKGIAFDACGVGADGLNDEILEALTRKGDGRYYFLDRPEDADEGFIRQLAGALRPAARNVKVQVKFNPQRVASYRLSGFEKHRLNKEDFRNDRVDAAELAAAESGNAIYQIEVDPAGQGDVGEVFVRFQDTRTREMVERSWPIAYQPSAPTLAEAPPSMQTAALASIFAEKLKGGPLGELVNLDELTPVTSSLRGHNAKTDTLIEMIEKARQLNP